MAGRWGGRASGQAGVRDFPRIVHDENESERRRREDDAGFSGTQGTGRPPHSMTEHASGMSDKFVRGYDQARDGSRFEIRYMAVEDQPWHVVDAEGKVKKFNSQEDAENYVLSENRKELIEESDSRNLHYRKNPKE